MHIYILQCCSLTSSSSGFVNNLNLLIHNVLFQYETLYFWQCLYDFFFNFICVSTHGQAKIPDIEKCLDVVSTLQAKKGTGEVSPSNDMNSYVKYHFGQCIEFHIIFLVWNSYMPVK